MEPQLGPLPGIPAVDQQLAFRGLIKPAHQIGQGGFAGTGFAHDGQMGSEGDIQREMLQDRLLPVGIPEGHIPEGNIALQHLPVFLFRIQGIAVFFDDLRGIGHIGFDRQQIGEPLNVDLGGDQIGNDIHQPPQRLHHALGIGHEHRESTDLIHRDVTALPQHNSQGHGRCEIHGACKETPEPGSLNALGSHIVGFFGEPVFHFLFDGQGFDGFCTGDALIEIACDPGIDLPDLPVHPDELFLEDGEQDHQQRQNGQYHGRKGRIQRYHHRHRAHQIGNSPDAVHQRPTDQTAYPGGIAHKPGVDIAHAVLIKIGKAQGLQVIEACLPQLPVHPHFDDGSQGAGNIVGARSHQNGQKIGNQKGRQGIKGPKPHETV